MSKSPHKSLYIMDGNSYAYRAFYGMAPLTTGDGVEVHAVYGFYNMFKRVIREKNPDYIALSFDHPAKTFRHEKFEAYKEKREKMPESLQVQMKIIKDIATKAGIPLFEKEGYEADDIMGSVAANFSGKDLKVFILSSDKDMIQMLDANTSIIKTSKGREVIVTPATIKKDLGIKPQQIMDVLALMGDASDNIPGVKGVGEKTAYKLVAEFGSVENIKNSIDKITPERVRKLVEVDLDNLTISRELVELDKSMTVIEETGFVLEKCNPDVINHAVLDTEFLKYNFKSLVSKEKVVEKVSKNIEENKKTKAKIKSGKTPVSISDFSKIAKVLAAADEVSIFFAGGEDTPELIFMDIAGSPYYIFDSDFDGLPEGINNKKIITNSAKNVFRLSKGSITGEILDISLMGYLLDPEKNFKDVSHIFVEYENTTFLSYEDVVGKGAKQIMVTFAEKDTLEKYISMICTYASDLAFNMMKKLAKEKMVHVYKDIEIPLAEVLVKMEDVGLKIDRQFLIKMSNKTQTAIDKIEKEIYKLTGAEFNINSPKQLGEILFEKMELPRQKKIKTGYSTNVEVLTNLEHVHPVISEILRYRTMTKLKTGFLDVMTSYMDKKDKIHPSYNQTIAATGRLSASNPNIQNIPIRGEEGREIRKIFVPLKEGETIFKADYSQVELRVMAHFTKDEKLIDAFKNGDDVHAITAGEIFGVKPEDVDKDQRRVAKTINFGIIYGQTQYGLAKQLRISNFEAADFIDKFFLTFPGVKKYQENVIQDARNDGYVTTLAGRRRYFVNIDSKNRTIRELSERAAINAPIQGTAADIIKIAMINIQNIMEKEKMKSKMILQVHDELVFSVVKSENKRLSGIVKQEMMGAMKLDVPLDVTIGEGDNWHECG